MATIGLSAADKLSPIESTQTTFERWVSLQETIASEKSDWTIEREYLNEEVRLLQEEIEALRSKKERLSEETATTDGELAEMDRRNGELKAAAALVEAQLPQWEASVRALGAGLPTPIQAGIEPLLNRLPSGTNETVAGVSERLLVVLGVLTQLDKANGEITVESEIQDDANGERVQVRVLYLGLSQAWFVGRNGKRAGYGTPGPDGWTWTRNDSLAPEIARAIEVHEGTAVASYVDLPVNIN